MKVLQINETWDEGGCGTIVKGISDLLVKHGYESAVAYKKGERPDYIVSVELYNLFEEKRHAIMARIADREGHYSTKATKNLIEFIEDYSPDIIHLHSLLLHYLNYPMLFSYLSKISTPVVWTLHDCWAITGHCINFEQVSCEKWLQECTKCPLKTSFPRSLFLDRSSENYREKSKLYGDMDNLYIVTPSKWLADKVNRSILKDKPLKVIHNGIDLELYKPMTSDIRKRYNIGDRKLLLASSCYWNKMKGYSLLCDIAEKIDSDYVLAVIGNKDEALLPENVISIPYIKIKEQMVEWYSAADVFVNPTMGDNFPTVNIEALSCGTPVVTCNTGGSPEIAGNTFGRIVYSKSAEEFIEKIKECIACDYSPDDCRSYAQKHYDKNIQLNEYLDLYRSLVY